MLWLWVNDLTETSVPTTLLDEIGEAVMRRTMMIMQLEVPLIKLAEEFAQQTQNMTCEQIYRKKLGLD